MSSSDYFQGETLDELRAIVARCVAAINHALDTGEGSFDDLMENLIDELDERGLTDVEYNDMLAAAGVSDEHMLNENSRYFREAWPNSQRTR